MSATYIVTLIGLEHTGGVMSEVNVQGEGPTVAAAQENALENLRETFDGANYTFEQLTLMHLKIGYVVATLKLETEEGVTWLSEGGDRECELAWAWHDHGYEFNITVK